MQLPTRGHNRHGVGSIRNFTREHNEFLYWLYTENPSRPREGYVVEFYNHFNIQLSTSFITRWFKKIGKYKAVFRKTSIFPPNKFSHENHQKLQTYLHLVNQLNDQRRLVFADEKPMKEIDIYCNVRRDPFTGAVPYNVSRNANSKNRYNILAAVCMKEDVDRNCEHVILEETSTAQTFQTFVRYLVEVGFLIENDVFVVNNCTIHMHGENEELQASLWNELGIVMIALPPYYPELNPTEFVFNYLVAILKRDRVRCGVNCNESFVNTISNVIDGISYELIEKEYKHCGYLKGDD